MSLEVTADNGSRASDSAQAVDVDAVPRLDCLVYRIQNSKHLVCRRNRKIADWEAQALDRQFAARSNLRQNRLIGDERESKVINLVLFHKVDDATDACIQKALEFPGGFFRVLSSGIEPGKELSRYHPIGMRERKNKSLHPLLIAQSFGR